MKRLAYITFGLLLCAFAFDAWAADYSVEKLDEAAPADEVAGEIAALLSPTGVAVKRSETSTLCRIWLCKQWPAAADFKPTAEVQFPFTPGQLIGVVQYKRRGEDFREHDLNRGVYTLRYAQQPVDGNHEGTSPTRDFLLVVKADADRSPKVMDTEKLYAVSAEAAESSHPGLLLMKKVPADADAAQPTIRHDEDDDWWIIRIVGQASAGGKTMPLAIDLVVVGHADE